MKNFEKYENEVREYNGDNFCRDFVIPHILKKDNCAYLSCSDCGRRQMLWFVEEYEESEVDWNEIEVDTPIMVKNSEYEEWLRRHFAKYENGKVYAWQVGCTSWTENIMTDWDYAKLAEDEKEPGVDWNKVEVDTPILVRDYEDTESAMVVWLKRYFAEYKDGLVYTWINGRTSWNEDCTKGWKYAKLAEDEE